MCVRRVRYDFGIDALANNTEVLGPEICDWRALEYYQEEIEYTEDTHNPDDDPDRDDLAFLDAYSP